LVNLDVVVLAGGLREGCLNVNNHNNNNNNNNNNINIKTDDDPHSSYLENGKRQMITFEAMLAGAGASLCPPAQDGHGEEEDGNDEESIECDSGNIGRDSGNIWLDSGNIWDGEEGDGSDDDGKEGDGSDAPVGVHVARVAAASRNTSLSRKQYDLAEAGEEKEPLNGSGVQ
jgi:hypothetical protein